MGLAEILRQKKTSGSKEQTGDKVEDKILAQGIKDFVEESRGTDGYKTAEKNWEKIDTLYEKADTAAVQIVQGVDGEDEFELVPKLNQISVTIDRIRDQFMDADQPPAAQARDEAEITDTDAIENLNDFLESYREFMDWHGIAAERGLADIKYGTVALYVGFDENKQYSGKIESEILENEEVQVTTPESESQPETSEDELKDALNEVIGESEQEIPTPQGEPFMEVLMPTQLAVDAECIKFEDSRTVVIERLKTRDALKAMFPDKKDEIDKAVKKASGNDSKGSKASNLERPVKLWEVFVDPNPFSDFYKKGLHAFCAEDIVFLDEEADWEPGARPVIFYIMEPSQSVKIEERTPWGYTKIQRLVPLQISLDNMIADMLLNARNDIPAPFYKDGTIHPEAFNDHPGTPIQTSENPSACIMRLSHSSNGPALLQMIQELKAAIEEISQVYSYKHGFKGGQRLATEIDALAEQQVKAYSEPIRHLRTGDKMAWRAFYNICLKHNKLEMPSKTPIDVDFVISSDDIPMPRAIARQRIDADAAAGLMGPLLAPGVLSDQAIIAVREARKKIGDDIVNPMLDLHDDLADAIIRSIEAGIAPPFISRYWNVEMLLHKLDVWAMEGAKAQSITSAQAQSYEEIRNTLEDMAVMAQAEKASRMQKAQAALQMQGQALGLGGPPASDKVPVTQEQPIPPEGVPQ
jgi:hypothetical protein